MAFLQHLPRFERLPGQSNASKIIENRGDEDRGNTEQGTIRPEDVMRPWTVAAKFLFSSFGCLWSAQVYVIPYTWVPMALANLFSCFFQETLAIEDAASLYEMLVIMDRSEWHWQEYIAPSRRKKTDAILPLGYVKDAPKTFFTTKVPFKSYLRALLTSQDFHSPWLYPKTSLNDPKNIQ
jgi:hypothetical protein